MKSKEEISETVQMLHNELMATIEQVEESHEVSYAELMCVLSGLLCGVAAESGMSYADFLGSMSMHFTYIGKDEKHYKNPFNSRGGGSNTHCL